MSFDSVSVRCYRGLLAFAPDEFRRRYADEAAISLASLLVDERRRRGRLAAAWLWTRAMADAIVTVRRERIQANLGGTMFSGLGDDLRYVLRSFRHAKAFALTAILTIGLGLGLNAGIFSFADGFLFRPLPFADSDRLFSVSEKGTYSGGVNLDDFDEIQKAKPGILGVATWENAPGARARVGDKWLDVTSYSVSPRFEDVLGFQLLRGRGFRDDEHRPISTVPCWVSFQFWQWKLGAESRAIGSHLTLLGSGGTASDVEIVGVLPPLVASLGPDNVPPDLWFPATPRSITGSQRNVMSVFLPIVRLAPGVTPESATSQLQGLVDGVQGQSPGGPHREIWLRSLRETQVRGGRPTAWLLFAVAIAVLVLVVVNLGHLLLARSVGRSAEVGVRFALGASRWRVVRLMLTESLTLTGVGLAFGLSLGWAVSRVLRASVPQYPSGGGANMSLVPMSFDHRVAGFTAALAVLTALAAGIVPAWRHASSAHEQVQRTLAQVRDRLSGRTARAILTLEVTIAATIVASAALVGTSAWLFLHQPLGFDPSHRYSCVVSPQRRAAVPADIALAMEAQLHDTLENVPGVTAVGFTDSFGGSGAIAADGHALPIDTARSERVDAGYLLALGVRLLAGRFFTSAEGNGDAPVAVIERDLADRIWPGVDPIGKVLTDAGGKDRTIVGVVPHVRWRLVSDTPQIAYVPLDPHKLTLRALVALPREGVDEVESTLTEAAVAVVPGGRAIVEPLFTVVARRDAGSFEFQGPVVALLGTIAFLLTGIGVYGLVTYLIEQRMREFGVRLALGARRRDLWIAVIQESFAPTLVGVALGLFVSVWAGRLLRSLLFGVAPTSPVILASVGVGLIGVSVLAAVRPARRVLHIDPVQVLRAD